MTEYDFLTAVAANPGDDGLWLIWADWLEEQSDQRATLLRQMVAVNQGGIPPQQVEVAVTRLATAFQGQVPAWRERVLELCAARPLRFQVLETYPVGNPPPQEMFGDARTVAVGLLTAGTAQAGLTVAIPLEDGSQVQKRIAGVDSWPGKLHAFQAFRQPLLFSMRWLGHLQAIQEDGAIVATDVAEGIQRTARV